MRVENPLRLVVELENSELLEYGLTFSRLDWHRADTKQLLNALLLKATRTTDFRLRPGRLLIEAYPSEGGGCTICFTVKQKGRVFRLKQNTHRIYHFSLLQSALDAMALAYISGSGLKSRFYKGDGGWLLAVWGVPEGVAALLNEFADSETDGISQLWRTEEHCTLICDNAIAAIGPHFINK